MARKVVGDVAVRVGADIGPLKIGLDRGAREVDRFERKGRRSGAALARNIKTIGLAAGGMATAIGLAARKAISSLDALGKKARQIGVTAESLQELSYAAVSAGVGITKLQTSMERFTKRLGEAAAGTGAAKTALGQLGLEAQDLIDMGIDDALDVIANKIAGMKSSSEQAATAAALFGREGVAMVEMLRNGSQGLDEFRRRAREAGAVIGSDLITKAEDLEDKIGTDLHAAGQNLKQVLIEIGPILEGLSETALFFAQRMADAAKSFDKTDPLGMRLGSGELTPELEMAMSRGDRAGIFSHADNPPQPTPPRGSIVIHGAGDSAGGLDLTTPPIRPPLRPADLGGDSGKPGVVTGPTGEDLKKLEESLMSQRELLQSQYEQDLADLKGFRDAKLIEQGKFDDLEQKLAKDHASKLAEIDRLARQQRLSDIGSAFGDLAALMTSENARLFKIGKAAAISEAAISGYHAAVTAWEKGMKIGGPPVAAAFAGASLLKTGALIAQIRSTPQSGGGAQANPGGGGGGGASAVATVEQQQTIRRELTINLRGGLAGQASGIRDILEGINEELDDGAHLNINIGS